MESGPENSIKLVLLGHPSDKLLPMNIVYGRQNQWLPVTIMLSIHRYSLLIAEPNITKIKKKSSLCTNSQFQWSNYSLYKWTN